MTDVYRQSWEKVPEGPKPDRRPEYTPTVDEMRDQWASSPRYRWAVMLSDRFADFDRMIAEVERAAAVKALRPIAEMVAPIIARIDPEQIGTHSTNCHQYHVGCLALAIQRSIHN